MYTYTAEIMSGKMRVIFNGLAFACGGVSGVFVNLVSLKINHYKFYIYLNGGGILVTSLFYLYLLESPFYYYKTGQIGRLFQCLLKMIHRNHPPKSCSSVAAQLQAQLRYSERKPVDDQLCLSDTHSSIVSDISESSLLEASKVDNGLTLPQAKVSHPKNGLNLRLFFTRSNLCRFAQLIALMLLLEIVYGLSILINKDLGISNIYLSGSLVCVFLTLGYLTASVVISKFDRRTLNLFVSVSISVLSGVMLAIDLIVKRSGAYSSRSQLVRISETGSLTSAWACHHRLGVPSVRSHLRVHVRTLHDQLAQFRHVLAFHYWQVHVRTRHLRHFADEQLGTAPDVLSLGDRAFFNGLFLLATRNKGPRSSELVTEN